MIYFYFSRKGFSYLTLMFRENAMEPRSQAPNDMGARGDNIHKIRCASCIFLTFPYPLLFLNITTLSWSKSPFWRSVLCWCHFAQIGVPSSNIEIIILKKIPFLDLFSGIPGDITSTGSGLFLRTANTILLHCLPL